LSITGMGVCAVGVVLANRSAGMKPKAGTGDA
jgi:hypothetical protein